MNQRNKQNVWKYSLPKLVVVEPSCIPVEHMFTSVTPARVGGVHQLEKKAALSVQTHNWYIQVVCLQHHVVYTSKFLWSREKPVFASETKFCDFCNSQSLKNTV